MRHAISPRLATRTLRSMVGGVAYAPGPHTRTRMGVGLYALHGLLSCGQFDMRQSTLVSAFSSTYLPPPEMPSANVRSPSGLTGTFMKKLMFGARSRFDSGTPERAAARRKLSRQLCIARVWCP